MKTKILCLSLQKNSYLRKKKTSAKVLVDLTPQSF